MSYTLVWQCNLCGAHGEGRMSETAHISKHTGAERECACGQRMSLAHLFFSHLHNDYCCDQCDVRMKTRSGIEAHLKRHTEKV